MRELEKFFMTEQFKNNITKEISNIFENSGVSHIFWKSSIHHSDALKGITDHDLYINPKDKNLAISILNENSWIQLKSQIWARYPNIYDFVKFDVKTKNLQHIHLHFDVLTGIKRVKNISLENTINWFSPAVSVKLNGMPYLRPEWEILIFLIRSYFKGGLFHIFKQHHKIPETVFSELHYLQSKANEKKVIDILYKRGLSKSVSKKIFKINSVDDFNFCANQICSIFKISLKANKVKTFFISLIKGVIQFINFKLDGFTPFFSKSKLLFDKNDKSYVLIGIDGSGKSTLKREIKNKLGHKMSIKTFYMGSGDGLFKNSKLKQMRIKSSTKLKTNIVIKSFVKELFYLYIATKNYFNSILGKFYTYYGWIVIFDRYPQTQYRDLNDGPKAKYKFTSIIEEYLMRKVVCFEPLCKIYLEISPKTSISRGKDNKISELQRKKKIIENSYSNLKSINAEKSLNYVVSNSCSLILENLAKNNLRKY